MVRLLFLLMILSLSVRAQSGRYHINPTTDQHKGYITITDHFIRIEQDSTTTILPVLDSGKDKHLIYFILEGCIENRYYRGGAILHEATSTQDLQNGYKRIYSHLYVELRARNSYISNSYSLYYDQ